MANGYFVRARPPGVGGSPPAPEHGGSRPRPRHRRFDGRRGTVVALVLVVGGALLWASRTDGGVSARVGDGIDWVKQATGLDDTDPTLRGATETFDEVWDARGNYAATAEELEVREPEIDWSSDLDWRECSGGGAVVIVVDTARGTRSRLLVEGESLGDVPGDVACPTDFADPAPWE